MRILIVDTYYLAFVRAVYARVHGLAARPYSAQWRVLMDECFGTADFYSANLNALGHEATEVVANCEPLQKRWAAEHGLASRPSRWNLTWRKGVVPWLARTPGSLDPFAVLAAQIEAYRPDVLYVQDPNETPAAFLTAMKAHARLIVGQIAVPPAAATDFSPYNLVLSSLPNRVRELRQKGIASEYFRLGFERTVLDKLAPVDRDYPVTHIGGYGTFHSERNVLLAHLLARGIPLLGWGYGINELPDDSALRRVYQGEAWGLDMYRIRSRSRIAISRHIRSATDAHANIMAMYETTGVGAMLVIDDASDMRTIFEPGKEAITYRSADECADVVSYYLTHDDERQAVARAGQERTLREHTYFHRMQELVGILGRYL